MLRSALFRVVICAVGLIPIWGESAEPVSYRVYPERVELDGPEATEQLLVFAKTDSAPTIDLTHQVSYTTLDTHIVAVSSSGRITPRGDGTTRVVVEFDGQRTQVPVVVRSVSDPPPVSYRRDIIPILTKTGCNSGGCHGKAEGQNGFKLSVFGYDVVADHQALVYEARGRRVFAAAPDRSLLLQKATAQIPHGGGQRIEPESRWYELLRRWIAEGSQLDEESGEAVAAIDVYPAEVILGPRATLQLRVTARYASGAQRGVTAEAEFQTNNDVVASVNSDGRISATEIPGEAAILVRYLGHVAVCRVTRPRSEGEFDRPAEYNFIDELVWNKLERLRIPASPLADDATFLRRVYLDTIGTLPTAAEARIFLADPTDDKRTRLIEQLLERPEYAQYWAQRWSDLLQVDKDIIAPQATGAMTRWLRSQFEANVPYDQFVRSILTAEGATTRESPAAFFQVQDDPEKLARAISQLFLGVRIECAQCHHHPFERWDQPDYFGLASFFTGIERKPGSAGSLKIVARGGEDMPHPRTGELVPARGLGAEPASFENLRDRRVAFANWATSPENPFFARAIVNRIWAHYFGRGLVEPVDDLRATNPASNEPLLNALTDHLLALRFDIKAFTRTLLESRTYQLSSSVAPGNELDEQNYSRAAWKPIPAEVLLDAICQATEVPEQFNGWPRGYRAIEIWDNKLPSHFLEVFGRPTRQTVCACERGVEPSIAQALHLMNSATTVEKVQHAEGRAARLAASVLSPAEIVEELYLATLARRPSRAEAELMEQVFVASPSRQRAAEDILWTLLNTKEFVFNH